MTSLEPIDEWTNDPIPLSSSVSNMNPSGTQLVDPSTSPSVDTSMSPKSEPKTSPTVNPSSTHNIHSTNMPYFVP